MTHTFNTYFLFADSKYQPINYNVPEYLYVMQQKFFSMLKYINFAFDYIF